MRSTPRGFPLVVALTPGRAADCPQLQTVLDSIRVAGPIGRPRTQPAAVAADKAYSSRANRTYLRGRRIAAAIPENNNQTANRRNNGPAGGPPSPSTHAGTGSATP